jgi:ankyrin repeat protein
VVVELLKHDKVDVNLQDKYGNTAFTFASENGQLDVVVELLKHDTGECKSSKPIW